MTRLGQGLANSGGDRIIIHNGLEGRAEHYCLGPFDGGNALNLYTAESVRI